MDNKTDIEEIIKACVNQNRQAQEILFRKYYRKMLTVCYRYTSDKDTASEIVQEGFIKIFDKLHTFDFKGSFEGWIKRIISNNAIDYIRKTKKFPDLVENETFFKNEVDDKQETEEYESELTIKADVAMEAITQLSPQYRTVFNMYVIEEYSHKEIAEILGISEGTSKSNLAKAKANLRKIIDTKLEKNYSNEF